MGMPHVMGCGGRHAAYAEDLYHESLMGEGAELHIFVLSHAPQFLVEVYGDPLHHNYGTHLDGGVGDDSMCQRRWWSLAAHSVSWYIMPLGAIGRRSAVCLAA